MPKIIHIPFVYFPDARAAGVEVYVQSLCHHLQQMGFDNVIAALGETDQVYDYEGIKVYRYSLPQAEKSLSEIYGEGSKIAADKLERILQFENPDLVHIHAYVRRAALQQARTIKQKKIPLIFTYHGANVSCPRASLLRWGKEICNGILKSMTCTQCYLQSLGAGRLVSFGFGILPPVLTRYIGK